MNAAGVWTRSLMYGATVVLTPLLLWMLARAFAARESSSLELQSLRARHKATETWASVFAIVGVVLGSLVLVPVVVIAIRTLPHGLAEVAGLLALPRVASPD